MEVAGVGVWARLAREVLVPEENEAEDEEMVDWVKLEDWLSLRMVLTASLTVLSIDSVSSNSI